MKKSAFVTVLIFSSVSIQSALAASEDYSFISGGLQLTQFNQEIPTKLNDDATSKRLMGGYLRGSLSFIDNVFAEVRLDMEKKDDAKITYGLIGLGYYQPINSDLSAYGLLGYATERFELPFEGVKAKEKEKGITAEVGAKYHVSDIWLFEPALRYGKYDKSAFELRLGNNIGVYDSISVEANIGFEQFQRKGDDKRLKQTKFTLGARYSF
ncbi:hypothetical protein CS022_20670 [Veronia nyctiphanis]|uniref:Outer membrane protein beta-barrel domain-containing protein n=1 Tax=Veronia nyctiphanis TaxID=1278244 RepID=A0A4Q0YL81_9GAMM|nr:outer membrane beta-barrel protein [Veronia nyctiphanis]RXJ71510.1 hypothetical protein CS022_20670 [Veronia nyctiphanis]